MAYRRAGGAVIGDNTGHEEVISATGHYGKVGGKWVQTCTGRPCEMPLKTPRPSARDAGL